MTPTVLALDTSGASASVALLRGAVLIQEILIHRGAHHSESLLPAVEDLCRNTGIPLETVDLLACTVGPGSFTGLRIGMSTVKGFAFASGRPVAAVSTLEALSRGVGPSPFPVCPLLDARKGQIYGAVYRYRSDSVIECTGPERLSDIASFLEDILTPALFVGDGALAYRDQITAKMGTACLFADALQAHVRAAIVGRIGYECFLAGKTETALSLTPRYLRLSEAETAAGGIASP